ncbi:MAG: hypothetical protein IPK97_01530 [Ahniella sp.]|nr:hypothetical protein [Ahniella sp.]
MSLVLRRRGVGLAQPDRVPRDDAGGVGGDAELTQVRVGECARGLVIGERQGSDVAADVGVRKVGGQRL